MQYSDPLGDIGPAAIGSPDNYTALMSNYSIYYLSQNNGIHTNCSVYSLISGSIRYQHAESGNWSTFSNKTDFLPAYYVTNCSMSDLRGEIANLSVDRMDLKNWLEDFRANPYNVADNGDSFVALLFMLSGSCVSCWMLMLLFILSPNHKRKPVLTQLATLFYSVVLTILLARITDAARQEYHDDSLNMIFLLLIINDRKKYPIVMIISQLLTQLAFVQLVMKMTKNPWKRINAAVGIFFIAVYLVLCSVNLARAPDFLDSLVITNDRTREIIALTAKVAFVAWVSITLAYHTLKGTESSPRQVSYSKRLFPLACFTWTMLVLHVVITILIATLWEDQWLVSAWITFLPYLLEMYVLTTAWEWFYSIRDLESRLELIGMLGRRISLDDVMSFSNSRRTSTRVWPIYNFLIMCVAWITGKSVSEGIGPEPDSENPENRKNYPNNDPQDLHAENTHNQDSHPGPHPPRHDPGHDPGHDNDHSDSDSDFSYDVQYVDDEEWANHHNLPQSAPPAPPAPSTPPASSAPHPVEGSSRMQEQSNDVNENIDTLPPFQPLPGFSVDDYWDEKANR